MKLTSIILQLRRSIWLLMAWFAIAVPAPQADGEPISFTFTGTASGTVGSAPFANAAFTIQLVADTDDAALAPDPYFTIWLVPATSATIEIPGVGKAAFTTGKRVFVNQNYPGLGFSEATTGLDFLDIYDDALTNYDLTTPIGPIADLEPNPAALQQFRSVASTLGPVSLTSARDVTFRARLGPPPVISGMPSPGLTLWPPNHQMVAVGVVTVANPESVVSFEVTGASNEPFRDPNNPDIVILGSGVGPRTILLRADRLPTGTGRVYTLNATAVNDAGLSSTVSTTCVVPRFPVK
jgi:hypothetical protein